MERNEFRERMNQFKKARETNPLLSYWEWKNSLPDNLANTPDWQYNNIGAWAGGLEPEMHEDGYYHLGSRNPQTGEILKPKSHPTYLRALEADTNAGYFPYEKNGRTYTKTYAPTGDLSGYAYGTSGIGNDDSFRYVDNPSRLNFATDLFNLGKITQDQFLKVQDNINAQKNESEETKQVSLEIDNARQWSMDWLNKRKATGKFEDQLTDDYMLFATNRFKNVMINVSSSPRNLSNDANGNFFAPPTKSGIGGINIRYNPNIDDLTKYSLNRNSNIIHEIAHAGTIFKNRKYSDEDWNNVYSPQIILINKLLGAPLTTTSSSVSLGDYAGSAPEIYARLQQMRWAMKADPTRVNYTYDELKPYLNIFLLDFGKEKTEALMNTIAFNQNNNSTSEFDNFVEDPQDVISPYNLRKDVLHVAKGGIIGYDDGTDGIKMTPEQEKKFLEDRQKYAAMSGAISPVLDIKTAADFTPVGNAIAGKEIYDAASDGNYLDAGLLGAALVVPPVMAKPIKRYIPTVSRTVADKISKLLDKGNAIKETEWNNTVNRAIERIYDKDVRDRAAYIKDRYGIDILSQYDAIDNLYTNNYESIPKAKITLMEDGARAKMHTKPLASKAWATEGKPAGMKDFEMRVRPDVEPSKEVAEHEVNHWWTYSMMQNPDWRRSELLKITKDFEGALHKTNPLDPNNSDYYRDWMELNAYGINVVNSMKELDIPFTKENVIKFINLKPDTSALKRAAKQFKNMDLYYDWLRTMPLAGAAGAAYMLGNKEDNSYSGGTDGVGLPKYYGAYDPKQLAYVLPVDKNAGVVLPEVEITPQNNTDLAGYMQKGNFVKEAAEFTPVGDVMDLYLIGKDAYEGNYGLAALGAGLFFLPNVIERPLKKLGKWFGKNFFPKNSNDELDEVIKSIKFERKLKQDREFELSLLDENLGKLSNNEYVQEIYGDRWKNAFDLALKRGYLLGYTLDDVRDALTLESRGYFGGVPFKHLNNAEISQVNGNWGNSTPFAYATNNNGRETVFINSDKMYKKGITDDELDTGLHEVAHANTLRIEPGETNEMAEAILSSVLKEQDPTRYKRGKIIKDVMKYNKDISGVVDKGMVVNPRTGDLYINDIDNKDMDSYLRLIQEMRARALSINSNAKRNDTTSDKIIDNANIDGNLAEMQAAQLKAASKNPKKFTREVLGLIPLIEFYGINREDNKKYKHEGIIK